MVWMERLAEQLAADRALAEQVYDRGAGESPWAAFVTHQRDRFGLSRADCRLPEHFRGPWEQAQVCFLGPHVVLDPAEAAPPLATGLDDYVRHYRERPERREPFGHYQAIMDAAPWLALELVRWPCEKELALQVLKGPHGPAVVEAGLELAWAMLRESDVRVLVLTGNDALKWVLPRLGAPERKLPGVTQLHGQTLGRFPLPGGQGRELTVVASFHWSPEMPMFVRKVPGLGDGKSVREAISGARRMVAAAIAGALG